MMMKGNREEGITLPPLTHLSSPFTALQKKKEPKLKCFTVQLEQLEQYNTH